MIESGFKYSINNANLISKVKAHFYSNKHLIENNSAEQNTQMEMDSFWEKNKDLYAQLNRTTYPKGNGYFILRSWLKYYDVNDFSGLHQEQDNPRSRKENEYSNSILIERSEDLIGGDLVIAGDGQEFDYSGSVNENNIRERLLTRSVNTPGEVIVWDKYAVHGVAKVEKGHRLVLVCVKGLKC